MCEPLAVKMRDTVTLCQPQCTQTSLEERSMLLGTFKVCKTFRGTPEEWKQIQRLKSKADPAFTL